jgi:uncharacterized protein
MSVDDRARLLAGASVESDRCSALSETGRCQIYDARPFVCRTHGAPIRMTRNHLPVIASRALPGEAAPPDGGADVIASCFRNFASTTPAADCVLDQTTLSAMTLAIDRDAGGDGSRFDLADVIRDC